MARGRFIDSYVKYLIATALMEHEDWSAAKVQEQVARQLEESGYRRKGPSWPSLSAVQKLVRTYTERIEVFREAEDDRPWTVLAMSQPSIQSESLSPILEVWGHTIDEGPALTIREARWVARLYPTVKDPLRLLACARYYAAAERLMHVTDSYPDDEEQASMMWLDDLMLLRDCHLMDEATIDRRLEQVVEKSPLPLDPKTSQQYRVGLSQKPRAPVAPKTRTQRGDTDDEDSDG